MYFTPDGLEQATRPAVTAHHAGRFLRADIHAVVDLCCGIGADSMRWPPSTGASSPSTGTP